MVNENYSRFTKTGQTRVFISPTRPKNTEKREKREREGKGARASEKKTSNSL